MKRKNFILIIAVLSFGFTIINAISLGILLGQRSRDKTKDQIAEVHNGESISMRVPIGDIDDEATVHFEVPKEAKKEQVVTAIISTKDGTPKTVNQFTLFADRPFRLQTTQASINKSNATASEIEDSQRPGGKRLSSDLDEEKLTGEGIVLSESYSNWAIKLETFVAFYEEYELNTDVRKITDDEVEITIHYKNTGQTTQEDVRISSEETIDLMDAVPDSSICYSSIGSSKDIYYNDGKYSLGDCKAGEEATIKYRAKLLDDAQIGEKGCNGVIVTLCYAGQDERIRAIGFDVSKDRVISNIHAEE